MIEPSLSGISAGPDDVPRTASTRRRLVASIRPCLRTSLVSGTLGLVLAALGLSLIAAAAILTFRHVDPPGSMLIWSHQSEGRAVDQRWVPLDRISPHLVRAVIMSEDNQFCRHHGVDVRELLTLLERAETIDDISRGGSTISMQVAKNLFLWSGKSYVRKAIELPLTLGMELVWPKHRIMEVYLNIAEWGPGVFGAEAAAQHHFRKPASRLTAREAALLAASLPNPITRVASRPSETVRRVAGVVEQRMKSMGTRAGCVLDP